MSEEEHVNIAEDAVRVYLDDMHLLEMLHANVLTFFQKHPKLTQSPFPVIHSIKSRFKDKEHLKEKIIRKNRDSNVGVRITKDNLFEEVTDLVGIRVLHLHQDQFMKIHDAIQLHLDSGEWVLKEQPTAYTWDPESVNFYKKIGYETKLKDSYYTSIHYTIKMNMNNPRCCEIQIRTLFEEVWGEVDHFINYPIACKNLSCREQLMVLSKFVAAGTRLVDSIFMTLKSQENLSDCNR